MPVTFLKIIGFLKLDTFSI